VGQSPRKQITGGVGVGGSSRADALVEVEEMGMIRWRSVAAFGLVLLVTAAFAHAEYFLTDLVGAAKRGDGHAVHNILQDDPDLSATGPMGFTALHWAGIRGHWRIVAELVAAGAPVNAVGSDGGTPLHWACHNDRADTIEILLDAGADLGVQNRWGRAPLHVAARRGCLEVAGLLLDRGADPSLATAEGWTPLHVAERSGHPKMVAWLLRRGADASLTDAEGLRPADSRRQRPREVTGVDPQDLPAYVGLYDLGRGFSVKVWREGQDLRIREFAPDDLYPIGDDVFSCRREPWTVRFSRGDDSAVTTAEIDYLRRSVTATKTQVPRYVGSRACMACHTGADEGRPDVIWLRSRHAHAYWRLGADWALFLGRLRPHYQDLEDPITDQRCLLCHVTGLQNDAALFNSSYRAEEGVSCEACHGPGSEYMDPEVMADREAFLVHGGRIPDETTCRSCHRRSEGFTWDEKWPSIAHREPAAEPAEESSDG